MVEPNQGFSVSIYILAEEKETFKTFKKLLECDPVFTNMTVKNPKKLVSVAFRKFMNVYVTKKSAELIKHEDRPNEVE